MPVLTADMVAALTKTGGSARVDAEVAAKFTEGAAVVARNINPQTHTRLPRYVRGKRGTIEHDHGVFAFPDTNAHGKGEKPQHVYSVRFTARELWGGDASERDSLRVDLWDDHSDPA